MSIENKTQSITSLKVNGVELSATLEALRARQTSITTALSSVADDYETEIIDARADTFGNSHETLGDNIRDNQIYLYQQLLEKYNSLQFQFDNLTQAYFNLLGAFNNHISKGDNN